MTLTLTVIIASLTFAAGYVLARLRRSTPAQRDSRAGNRDDSWGRT